MAIALTTIALPVTLSVFQIIYDNTGHNGQLKIGLQALDSQIKCGKLYHFHEGLVLLIYQQFNGWLAKISDSECCISSDK